MRTGASNHRRALLGGVLVLSLVSAACSSGSSDSSKKPGPVTTSSVKTSGNKTTTSTPPEDDDVFGRPKPTLGDRPEGVSDPPIQLESSVDGAPAGDEAPSGLRSLRSVPVKGGPVRLVPGGKTGWQKVPSNPPKKRTNPGDEISSDTQVYADGTERVIDYGTGRVTEYRPDGSVRIQEKNGAYAEFGPEGGSSSAGPGRGIHTWGPDGSEGDLTKDGYREKSPDGTITTYDPDGSGSPEVPPPTYGPPVPTPPGKTPSGGTGEPHYLTEDGASITTQSLGEFVLSTGVEGQEVQARTEPYGDSTTAAAISALALGVGDQRVMVEMDGTVTIDGEMAPEGEAMAFGFDDGGAVGVWRDAGSEKARAVVVVWPDQSTAWITPNGSWIDLRVRWQEATGDREGVLGSDDGDPANDLTHRDGTAGSEDTTEDVVRSWQVSEEESLFDYDDGKTTADYIVDDFPKEAAEPDLDSAAAACEEVPEGFARESCQYDVAVTGDDAFVATYEDYGTRIAGDASRRSLIEELTTVLTDLGLTGGGGDDDEPVPTGDGIELSPDERSGAESTTADDTVTADLTGDEVAVYSFEVSEASTLSAFSTDLSCPNEAYVAGEAGYAFFDDRGTVVSGPRLACDDDPSNAEIEPGTYYLKLVGPGTVGVDVNLFPT